MQGPWGWEELRIFFLIILFFQCSKIDCLCTTPMCLISKKTAGQESKEQGRRRKGHYREFGHYRKTTGRC